MKFLLDDIDEASDKTIQHSGWLSLGFLPKSSVWSSLLIILFAGVGNLSIWLIAIFYINSSPKTYTSDFAASLPGTGSTTEVGVPGQGNASYVNWSPYAGATYDPREDYKVIAQSEAVIQKAAAILDLEAEEFGQPDVSPRDNTTLIEFSVSASSPEEAQERATAFYTAFEAQLDKLRLEDIAQRERTFDSSIEDLRHDVDTAQAKLTDFQIRSGLSTTEQISQLAENIENLRFQLAETISGEKQAGAQRQKISSQLKLPEQQADLVFALQSDTLYQEIYLKYEETTAALVQMSAEFTPEYIGVVETKAKQDAARQALLDRAASVLGIDVTWDKLERLTLLSGSETAQNSFLQELTQIGAQQEGLQSRSQELNTQISLLENRLTDLATKQSTLNSLQRDLEIAETVFSSSLARASLGRSNIYASYPEIRLVQQPSKPQSPSSPNKPLVFLGTAMSSIFITSGCILLLIYKRRQENLDVEIYV